MTDVEEALSSALLPVLAATTVTLSDLRATIADREVSADSVPELRGRLATALYEEFHQGHRGDAKAVPRTLRDPEVERSFLEATPHRSTELPARFVADDGDGTTVVVLQGVRVAVPTRLVRRAAAPDGQESLFVRVEATRAALSPGFFLADGSRGAVQASEPQFRVYLHVLDETAAIQVWRRVLEALEALRLRYRAKVLSARSLYPRRDAVVVYLAEDAWHVANDLVVAVDGLHGLGASVSPFCEELAPGVSRAQEPVDTRPGRNGLSFGEHRAAALAQGLVDDARLTGAGSREHVVATALRASGVDPSRPHLNTAVAKGFPARCHAVHGK